MFIRSPYDTTVKIPVICKLHRKTVKSNVLWQSISSEIMYQGQEDYKIRLKFELKYFCEFLSNINNNNYTKISLKDALNSTYYF